MVRNDGPKPPRRITDALGQVVVPDQIADLQLFERDGVVVPEQRQRRRVIRRRVRQLEIGRRCQGSPRRGAAPCTEGGRPPTAVSACTSTPACAMAESATVSVT